MSYNGWKNRQTWNVALWIGNDYGIYSLAREFMQDGNPGRAPYARFVKHIGLEDARTPDGIAWLSTRLSYRELNSMMQEL